jgi:hypothetical protein
MDNSEVSKNHQEESLIPKGVQKEPVPHLFKISNMFGSTNYVTKSSLFCLILLVALIPTLLFDTIFLNQINSAPHLSIIFVLVFVIAISLFANTYLKIVLENIDLNTRRTYPVLAVMAIGLVCAIFSTVYYQYSALSIFLQLLFRLELSLLILELVSLQLLTEEKTAKLIKSFIIFRDTLEMIEMGDKRSSECYAVEIKKRSLVQHKPQILCIQHALRNKLILSCTVVLLLIILGIINIAFWTKKMKFMIFVYVSFTIPVLFSAYQITHFNEKVGVIEDDLKIRTFLRVKLFGWVPRRELILGTVLSLSINALRIFLPSL